jgi:hypothetical protein
MDDRLKGKLTRYIQHYATDFLFGLPEGTNDFEKGRQKHIYQSLRAWGKKTWGHQFDFRDRPYDEVTSQLLNDPGIEKLVQDYIVKRVNELFSGDLLSDLRFYWRDGSKPNEAFLRRYRIDRQSASPFLVVSELKLNQTVNHNVDRWGEFAWLWFEEIEPWIRESPSAK